MDNSVHSTWKSKEQLSHVLQTELPTIPKDSQLYTLPPMPTTTESLSPHTKCQKLLTFLNFYHILKMSKVFDINILLKGENIMPVPAQIFLGVVFLVFAALDIIMLISLLKPGDERNQTIVWKASSFTLFATVGAKVVDVIENFIRAQPMTANPLIQLEVAAIVYCISLVYYKKRHGG